MLDVFESLNLLKLEGLPVVKGFKIDSVNALKIACEEFGYPIVMKIVSAEHKIDIGGVKTNIKDYEEAVKTFKKLSKITKEVLIQPQVKGLELSLGIKKDPVFDQVILFGLGGMFIELIKDVSLRVCPVTKKEAHEMINELKTTELLKGYRGKPGVDLKKLENLIVNLSRIAIKKDIKELDINPLIAQNKEFNIVDARVDLERPE